MSKHDKTKEKNRLQPDANRGQAPRPQKNNLQELLDEGGPLQHAGELRGDQQQLHNASQHGAVERPTAHRGRDSLPRTDSH